MEAAECGAASLAMVLAFYGRHLPLAELRPACNISRDGSRAGDLLRAGRSYGLISRGWRATPAGLRELPLPAILFWNHHHFVVLEAWGEQCAWLNDPAFGHRHVSEEELAGSFSRVALTFSPGPEFKKQSAPGGIIRWAFKQFYKEPEAAVHLVFGSALLAVPPLAVGLCMRIFVDEYYLQGEYHWLPSLLTAMAGAAALQIGLTLYLRRVLLRWEAREAQQESREVLHRLLALSLQDQLARGATELAARMRLATDNARLLFREIGGWLLQGPTAMLSLLWMSLCGGRLLFLVLPLLAGGFYTALLLQRIHREPRAAAAIRRMVFTNTILRGFSLPDALKFGGQQGFLKRLEAQQRLLFSDEQAVTLHRLHERLFSRLQSALAFTAMLALGLWEIVEDRLSIGAFIALLVLWIPCNRWVLKLFIIDRHLSQLALNRERLTDLPAASPPPHLPKGDKCFERLEIRGVTFGYTRSSTPLLSDLNLSVAPGQQIALVGASGSGRSTLARLLMGLLNPAQGEVLLNSTPVAPERFAALGGWSDAEPIFTAQVARDHLWLGNESLSPPEAATALAEAGVSEALAGRPLSLGAGNLSAGERRLLEMARLFARAPGLVILDEPTGDLGLEQTLALADRWRQRGCASIWITCEHDLICQADAIWFLDAGRVTTSDSYEALLLQNDSFRQLMTI